MPELSPSFFVGLGIIVFLTLVYKPLKKGILGGLDARAKKIRADLDEALRLKEEAQVLLASFQRKQLKAEEEAKAVVEHAKEEARRIRDEAKYTIEAELAKRTEIAMQRIAQAESAVIEEIRQNVIDVTLNAAQVMIEKHLGKDAAETLVKDAIQDIGRKIH